MPNLRITSEDGLSDLLLFEDPEAHRITVAVVPAGEGMKDHRVASLNGRQSMRLIKYFEEDRRPGGMLSHSCCSTSYRRIPE